MTLNTATRQRNSSLGLLEAYIQAEGWTQLTTEKNHQALHLLLRIGRGGKDAIATDIMAKKRKGTVKASLFPGISNPGGKCFLSNGLAKWGLTTNSEITDDIWESSLDDPKRQSSSVYHYRIQTLQESQHLSPERSKTATFMLQEDFQEPGGRRHWDICSGAHRGGQRQIRSHFSGYSWIAFTAQPSFCSLIHCLHHLLCSADHVGERWTWEFCGQPCKWTTALQSQTGRKRPRPQKRGKSL